MALKRTALGRGLDSLISMDDVPARGSSAINDISLDLITPNPEQPRSTFDEEALGELAASIRELGIIQPLSLRKVGNDSYQIIAGERRYRAARMAGLTSVPAYIRTANEAELTEMALIENIQREDLNAIEIALTFKKLIDQYSLTQERLSMPAPFSRLPAPPYRSSSTSASSRKACRCARSRNSPSSTATAPPPTPPPRLTAAVRNRNSTSSAHTYRSASTPPYSSHATNLAKAKSPSHSPMRVNLRD